MITVEYAGHEWQFDFVQIGGSSLPTKTANSSKQFESYLIVKLLSPMMDLEIFYLILSNLVKDRFFGWIVADKGTKTTLTSWEVKREDNCVLCKVGYKAWMPNQTIEYTIKETN